MFFLSFFHGNVLAGIFSSDAMVRIIGAFCVRVPVSWFMSRRAGATLFDIGLATPFSSILQLVLCLGCMLYLRKKNGYVILCKRFQECGLSVCKKLC